MAFAVLIQKFSVLKEMYQCDIPNLTLDQVVQYIAIADNVDIIIKLPLMAEIHSMVWV